MEKDKRTEVQRRWESLSTVPLIWIDFRVLFWILILIVRHCESRGVLTIRLLHYQNDYGQTFDGDCCDHRPSLNVFQSQNCGVQCDYVLRLLITGLGRANEHVFRFRRPIKYNENNIKFEDSAAELTIPFSSWPGEAGLLVFFYDYDDTDDSARLVDWFQTRLTQDKVHPGNMSYQELDGKRKLHKTRLQFDWSVRSERAFKKADSSNPFTTSTSPTGGYRSVRKSQNAKYERIKEVTPVISKTMNSSSLSTSREKVQILHIPKVTKRLSLNKTDSFFTISTNGTSWIKLHEPINEAKRFTSQILSPSEPTDFIKNIHVIRQNKSGLFDNKTTSRFYGGTSHQTSFFTGRLNTQSKPTTLSTSSQSVNNSRIRLLQPTSPSSVTVQSAITLKSPEDIKSGRSRVTKGSDENNNEFSENNSFTFNQPPSIVVTKWQESLDNAKQQVIKTAAAATPLQMRKKTRKDSLLNAKKERVSSPSEETVNDLEENSEKSIKPSELNNKIAKNFRLKEQIVKDVQLNENAGNDSHPNNQIKNPYLKIKYKSSDSHKQVTVKDISNGKLETVTNNKSIQITESEFQLEAKGTRFKVNSNDSRVKTIDFTNKQIRTNKKISIQFPINSTLNYVDNLLDLTSEEAVTVRHLKSTKNENVLGNVRKMADSITIKYKPKDKKGQKPSTSNPGFKISTEKSSIHSGNFDKAYENISNTNSPFPYSRVVPITTIGTSFIERNSSAHGGESADSTFKTRLLTDHIFSYHLHHDVPSSTIDHQTTTQPFAHISSHFPQSTFDKRLSLLEDSRLDINTELSPRTASQNVLTPSFKEIQAKAHGSVLKTEQRRKEKHFFKSGPNFDQISIDHLFNPTTSIRHGVSFLYSTDKSQSGISVDVSSPASTKLKDPNRQRKHPKAGLNTLKTTNKKSINSVASRREKSNEKTFSKNKKQEKQKKMEEDDNNSTVLKENGLRNKDSIKELRHSKLLEIDSSKKQYTQRQNLITGNKEIDVSKFTDREEVSKDQTNTVRESNTQTKDRQKISGKVGIDKNNFLYKRGYSTTTVSWREVNKNKPDGVLRNETNDISMNKNENKHRFSLQQIVRPTVNQKHDTKKINIKLDTESEVTKTKNGFISPESMLTTIKETKAEISSADHNNQNDITEPEFLKIAPTDNMASILFPLPNFKDHITTKKHFQQTYTFPKKEIGTTEEIALNENYPTKENSDDSKYSKNFLKYQKQTILSPKQSDKNILNENDKTWTEALREGTQSMTTSTIKSYYENKSLTNSTIIPTKSVYTRLKNNKETVEHKNADRPVTNSFLTEKSYVKDLEFTKKRSQNPNYETNFMRSDNEEKTVNIPTKRTSVKGFNSKNYILMHNMSTSNPFSAEKIRERGRTELTQRPSLDKNKNVHSEDEIKVGDITIKERKNTSTHGSIKVTMADNENRTENPKLHNVSLWYTRKNLLTLELKSKLSLEYFPVTISSNKDFNLDNRNIQTKENTLVKKIIDGRYRKMNEKNSEKGSVVDRGLQFENYEDKLYTGNSLEPGFSNGNSIFPVFSTTPGFNLSPGFDLTIVAKSKNDQKSKAKDSTVPIPSRENFELEIGDQNDSLSRSSPQTTRRYKMRSEDNNDDDREIVTTISKAINKNPSLNDVTKIIQNKGSLKTLKNFHSRSVSKTTSIWNQTTVSLPFSQENRNPTKIKTRNSKSIKTKDSTLLSDKNRVTPDKLGKSENNPNIIEQTLSTSSGRNLKMKILASTKGYLKRTLPRWIIFPQNFEDFLRHSHRKPYKESSQRTMPATKISPSYKQNKMRPKAAAKDKLLSSQATTPAHFIPHWSTVYLKEKKLYQPTASSLSQNQSKRTNQKQKPKNATDKIGWATISNTRNISNTNLLQGNSIENWGLQSIQEIRDVFEKYWPAILGLTFGTLFLGAAILTSFMCKRRTHVRRRRVKRSSQDQRYSPQPPVSEYSSGSSLFEENSPVSEIPTSLDEIS